MRSPDHVDSTILYYNKGGFINESTQKKTSKLISLSVHNARAFLKITELVRSTCGA